MNSSVEKDRPIHLIVERLLDEENLNEAVCRAPDHLTHHADPSGWPFSGRTESWSPAGETEVLKAMKSFRFYAEGVTRTYFNFYLGFGLILSVYLFLQAILLWQLAALAKAEALRLRPLIVSFFIASVVSAGLSWQFIFAVPAVSFIVIAVGLGCTFFAASEAKTPNHWFQRTVRR